MRKILKILLRTFLVFFILLNVITAFHAYKFTHFYDQGEVTVKKNEDKSGWDKTKEVLFGINAVKRQNDAVDSIYQNIYLTTKNRLKLQGWYIPVDTAKGTVLLFHGHGGTKSGVIAEAAAFRKMGYNTLLMDFRAHGNSEGNTCTIGFKESEDVKLAFDYIKGKGEKNIVLWGISMGAATIAKAIADYDLKPTKVIMEMPFGSILAAAEGRIKMMKLPAEPLAALVTFWGGVENGFWAFSMKPSNFVKKISCPVLLQWGKNDPRVSKEETEEVFHNINTQKEIVIYENSGHESLCKKENEKWLTTVTSFLQ